MNDEAAPAVNVEISDYVSVRMRALDLGCILPADFAILPSNFESVPDRSDFHLSGEGSTVRTVLRNGGLTVENLLPPGERATYVLNNSADWIGPTLFISGLIATQNQNAVSLAIGLITNHLYDLFKGRTGSKTATFAVVVERDKDRTCKKIIYEGPVEGIPSLVETIRQIADDRSDR